MKCHKENGHFIIRVDAIGMHREGKRGLLFYSLFSKFCGYKSFIRNTFRKLTGFFQDILQEHEGILFKNQILLPGILCRIPGNDGGDGLQFGTVKLRSNDSGNFLRSMAAHIVHAFLQRIGKGLDHFRIIFDIAFLCTERRVGNIAGAFSQGSNDVAIALFFQRGGVRLKLYSAR